MKLLSLCFLSAFVFFNCIIDLEDTDPGIKISDSDHEVIETDDGGSETEADPVIIDAELDPLIIEIKSDPVVTETDLGIIDLNADHVVTQIEANFGGVDTETGIRGIIQGQDGMFSKQALVLLVPQTYVPYIQNNDSLVKTAYTDSLGYFRFEDADSNTVYNIQANLGDRAVFYQSVSDNDSLTLILRPTNTLAINLAYVDYPYQTADSTRAYFPGTTIFIRCETYSLINNIPVGVNQLTLNNENNEKGERAISELNTVSDTVVTVYVEKYLGQAYNILE